MPLDIGKLVCIYPLIAEPQRKDLNAFCVDNEISSIASPETSISMLIHLDSILHKTLLISGLLAQSRPSKEMRIEDLVLAFNKATSKDLECKNNDRELFEQTLEWAKTLNDK